jgi:hypothetical protein
VGLEEPIDRCLRNKIAFGVGEAHSQISVSSSLLKRLR